jgi:hypothetical protein
MNNYVFLIGTHADFDSPEELRNLYLGGNLTTGCGRDFAAYKFSLPEAPGFEDGIFGELDIATLVGRGMAFTEDWRREGTYSFVMKVSLEPGSP